MSLIKIGDAQFAHGDLGAALKSYEDSLAIIGRLAKSGPGNAERQRDLAVSYEKIGNVQVAQGDLAGALKSYEDSLAIASRLAKSGPVNAGWQRSGTELWQTRVGVSSIWRQGTGARLFA